MNFKKTYQETLQFIKRVYHQANELSGGVLGIVRETFTRFGEERGSEAAASLAYYALFSIFPLLLVFIVVGSFFVDRATVQIQLLLLLQGVIPGAEDLVIGNIDSVLEVRGAITFVALISLAWSATSVFNILAKNINRAFPDAIIPDFVRGRILGLIMVLGLGLLMLSSFAASTLSSLIPEINIPINGKALHETFIWQIGAFLIPVGTNFLMFWTMYRWVPTVHVNRKAALTAGLVAGVAWELLNNAFTWYLSSGLSQYRLIYGSIATVIVMLFWIFLTSHILLLGAHLTAAIQKSMAKKTDALRD